MICKKNCSQAFLMVVMSLILGGWAQSVFCDPSNLESVGIFEDHTDFGNWILEGDANYDPQTGAYEILGTGADSGTYPDFGHAAYSEITGYCRLKARVSSDGPRAAYLGFSDDLNDKGSTWYVVWVDFVDNEGVQAFWRTPREVSWETTPKIPSDFQDGLVEVVREGNVFTSYYYDRNSGDRIEMDSRTIELTDPIHVLLASWSGSLLHYNVAHFSEVELVTESPSFIEEWEIYE